MTPEEILKYPARVLTQAQREHYFEKGYVGVESLVPADIIAELNAVTAEFVDASRKETGPADLRRDLFEAMKQVAETGQGPRDQTPSMGCSIKWKTA